MKPGQSRERVIVFDVNETLLDIESLNPFFEHTFGDARVMRQWFGELILYSEAVSLSGRYTPFGQLAMAVLNMVAEIRGVSLLASNIETFKDAMGRLPAHPDAAPALQRLADAGFRLATLTNSTPDASTAVLEQAGLAQYFERQFSVDAVQRFKPAAEVYHHVAAALESEPSALRMVAAHAWDTYGAMVAGWHAALVTRPGNAALPLGDLPDIIEQDLLAVAERIITIDVQ